MMIAMSDANFQSLMQMIGMAILAYLAYRTEAAKLTLASLKKDSELLKEDTSALKRDVEVVHKATNSIVEQLVAAALIKGRAEGKATERERAGTHSETFGGKTVEEPISVVLATTDVKTGEQLADKDDMISAVKEAAEAVTEVAKEAKEKPLGTKKQK